MPSLKYSNLTADQVVPCLLELGRQLVEEVLDDSPPTQARVRALQARLDRLAVDWQAGRVSVEAVGDRLREVRLESDGLDVEHERAVGRVLAGRGQARLARRSFRRAERMRRRLWAERRAHLAVLVGLPPSTGRVRARPRRRRGQRCGRRRAGASRDGPGDDGERDEGAHDVGRRRRRAP